MPTANRDMLRTINRSSVLNMIRTQGPVSRVDIARQTGLSQATITSITSDLMDEALIIETQLGDSTGGRPPILLDLNPEAFYVIGIKLAEDHLSAALTSVRADVVSNIRLPASGEARSVEWALDFIEQAIEASLYDAQVDRSKLKGVGIGMAGIIDPKAGRCLYSPYFHWENVPFRTLVEQRLGIPVYIDNDVNTLTMAEKWFGVGRNNKSFLVITIGRGVGMGLMFNDQFYRGAHGGGGEFGHTVINPDGPLCDCGKHGCLEAYIGDRALLTQARSAMRDQYGDDPSRIPSTIDEAVALAYAGEERIQAILRSAGTMLGVSIANMISVLDPELIVITGEGMRAGDLLFSAMHEAIGTHVFHAMSKRVRIVVQEWGDDSWARGAASLVLTEIYSIPFTASA